MTSLWCRLIALAALLSVGADGFTIQLPNKRLHVSFSCVNLRMATTPPPPSPPIQQVKVVPSSSSTTEVSQSSATNLPSQEELAQKASSQDISTASIKPSTNVASGVGVTISDIHYDGVVPKTESDEYVVITNNYNSPIDVSGYYIYVATTGTQGPTFTFPKGTTLKANQSIRVYTNEIHKETGGFSYGSGKAVWSNNGGLAVLKDASGKKLMEYKYKPR